MAEPPIARHRVGLPTTAGGSKSQPSPSSRRRAPKPLNWSSLSPRRRDVDAQLVEPLAHLLRLLGGVLPEPLRRGGAFLAELAELRLELLRGHEAGDRPALALAEAAAQRGLAPAQGGELEAGLGDEAGERQVRHGARQGRAHRPKEGRGL